MRLRMKNQRNLHRRRRRRLFAETLEPRHLLAGPYAPAAGQVGSDAVAHDDPSIVAWASRVDNYTVGTNVDIEFQTPANALGPAAANLPATVSLGRGGSLTLGFDAPIRDGLGADFVVFENGINGQFLELGYVEVSSDGVHFVRFASDSLTPAAVDAFGTIDPTEVDNLAGKYDAGFGTPFDLAELAGGDPQLDTTAVTHVRLIDVVGDGTAIDAGGDVIFDPYPTVGSAGFDADAVGVIHQSGVVSEVAGFEDVGANLTTASSFSGPDPAGTTAPGPHNNTITTGKFTSETLDFNNSNESSFGAWTGWAYSNVTDNTTEGFTNQFGVFAGGGASGSATFGLGFVDVNGDSALPTITRQQSDLRNIDSIKVTNSTYAALSMINGDQFAKKFGGASGNDPDFLLLKIDGKDAAGTSIGTVDFYLADYRFNDNTLDYVVDQWIDVDLSSIATARTIEFSITSSDVGSFGINTPAYFAIDDIRFVTPVLPIDLADVQVVESDGASATIARVSRTNLDTTQPITVSLTTDVAGVISIPPTVTILAGESFVDFPVAVVDDQVAAGNKNVSIVASANGFVDGNAILEIVDDEVRSLTVSLESGSVNEGDWVDVIVSRNDADTSQSQSVSFDADPAGLLGLQSSYEIPAGQASATFAVMAVDDQVDRADTQVTLSVSAGGYTGSSANVTVVDDDVAALAINVDPSVYSEDAGATLIGLEDRGARLPVESFDNGSDLAGGFVSSALTFNNQYDPAFGSWSGWSVSNVTDTTTAGFTNQYSAIAGGGADGSQTFAVASTYTLPTIVRSATSPTFAQIEVTNTTYAALSMLAGDSFAKKFGGDTGDDEDFFLLTIEGVDANDQSTGTVDFYLADYRFTDNTQDYIVDQWTTIDLTSLGDAIELQFSLTSSDEGDYGINTPAYFALDNVVLGTPSMAVATVSRNSDDLSLPLEVELQSDDVSEVRVAPIVTIPAGEASVSVPIEVRDDAIVDGTQTAQITVSADGFVGDNAPVSVQDNDLPALTLTALTSAVTESQFGRLLLHRNTVDTSQPIAVTLVPQTPGLIAVDTNVVIPAGAERLEVPFTAIDDDEINDDRELVIDATSSGFLDGQARVEIVNNDFPPPALALELSSHSLNESDAPTAIGWEDWGARLADGGYDNGSTGMGGFDSGGLRLNNSYDDQFGSWSGWAISKTSDMVTPGFENQFSAIAGGGVDDSDTYAVASAFLSGDAPMITMDDATIDRSFESLMITNTTYAALSMRDGDSFAKKFGGPSGDDEDFFLLQIEGIDVDGQSVGNVDFYLADFRFSDNSEDYIVDQWTRVDVSSLVGAVQLSFSLSSSDVGAFGMNTPAYFAVDHVVLSDPPPSEITATVSRNDQDLSSDLVVDIDNDEPLVLRSPSSVTIPAGSDSVTFDLVAVDNAVVDGTQQSVISVSAAAHAGDQASVSVADDDVPTLTVTPDASSVAESDSTLSIDWLIHRNSGDLSAPLTVTFSLQDGAPEDRLQFPSQVTIQAGARTAMVQASAIDDGIANGDQVIVVDAVAEGFNSTPISVTVMDDEVAGWIVTQTDGTTEVGVPGQSDSVMVRLAAQPASDVVINLVSQSDKIGLSVAELVFAADQWDVNQTIEVTSEFDFEIEDDFVGQIVLSVDPERSDSQFVNLADTLVAVQVVDFQPLVVRLREAGSELELVDDDTGIRLWAQSDHDGMTVLANDFNQTLVIDPLVQSSGFVIADLAGGDDVAVVHGTRFTAINAGDGYDRFVVDLSNPMTQVDLVNLFANRTIGFEEFEVVGQSAEQLVFDSQTVSSLAGDDDELVVQLSASQQLKLTDDASSLPSKVVDGRFMQVIQLGGTQLNVVSQTPWHNVVNAYDVNQSGQVTPADILSVINRLADGPETLEDPVDTASTGDDLFFVDVNADSLLSPADILEVINHLAQEQAATGGTTEVPQGELVQLAAATITLDDRLLETESIATESSTADQPSVVRHWGAQQERTIVARTTGIESTDHSPLEDHSPLDDLMEADATALEQFFANLDDQMLSC